MVTLVLQLGGVLILLRVPRRVAAFHAPPVQRVIVAVHDWLADARGHPHRALPKRARGPRLPRDRSSIPQDRCVRRRPVVEVDLGPEYSGWVRKGKVLIVGRVVLIGRIRYEISLYDTSIHL